MDILLETINLVKYYIYIYIYKYIYIFIHVYIYTYRGTISGGVDIFNCVRPGELLIIVGNSAQTKLFIIIFRKTGMYAYILCLGKCYLISMSL